MMQTPSAIPKNLTVSEESVQQAIALSKVDFPLGLFLITHLLLGFFLRQAPSLGTIHAYATILLGVVWALSKSPFHTALIAAYITGSEVLWRMTDASVPWEIGKYAVVLMMGLSLLHHRKKRIPIAPLVYFVLLLPSMLLTLGAVDLPRARELISFNLSGPLALFVSAWFFSELRINVKQLIQLLFTLVAPIATAASYALLLTFSAAQIRWVNDSMFATSGGFGPNQVSTIMGLGISAICMLLLIWRGSKITGWFLLSIGITLFVQGLLTFSRGGMVAALVVVGFAIWHFMKDARQRGRLLILVSIIVPLVTFIVLPALNEFTDGFLEQRFSDSNLSNRDAILIEELQLFESNPIGGIGPGMGTEIRRVAAHTEMTRLLAEHGVLGLVSLAILFITAIRRYLSTASSKLRGLYGGWMIWSLLVMTNAAMRIAAISFIYGLAFVQIDLNDSE